MSIGERIEQRLSDLKWSQSRLARETGLPQTTINSLIRRGARMTPHIGRLASALRTSPAYLAGETDDPEVEMKLPDLSYEQRQLLMCFDSMDRSDQEMLLAMAMRLAERTNPGRVHAQLKSYNEGTLASG